MNFAFIWPGVEADPNVGGGKSGYFSNPAGPAGQFAQLGGQGISVVANSENKDAALEYIKWFAQKDVQQKWWDVGGAPAMKAVLEAPGFNDSQPFAKTFLNSMAIVKDFWAEPLMHRFYCQCRNVFITTLLQVKEQQKKRWTVWSKTGQKSLKMRANSSNVSA